MRKFLLLSFMLMLAFSYGDLLAQERTISGKVTSVEDGSTLPGVNVVLKGTTSGTVTDVEGNYTLAVPSGGGTLVFSFIGLASEEIEIGTRSVIDVQMSADVKQLSEVVVTALGNTQNARSVTYGNQTVGNEDLLTTPNKNALEALRGKAAGVKITTGSGSVGASTRIVLRGEASLTGNNNALIVIDGIPIDNSSSVSGPRSGEGGYSDFGNRFNDFDPNNIESVTILKGPSATSLYGSRGASGVVLITTKTGSKNFKINLNSTTSVERAYVLLERQDQFGQGYDNSVFDTGENWSWGPPLDGVVRPWTSPVDADGDGDLEYLSRPYSAVEDQLQDFFRSGYTLTNSLSFSGGNDIFTYYASYGNTTQEGILDNTDYSRHNVVVNTTAKLSDKLSSSLRFSYAYVDQNTTSEGSRAFEGLNAYSNAIQAPITIPYNDLRNYNSPFHNFAGYYGSYTFNPYFILNEYVNNGKTNNVLANFSLTYKPIENLTLNTRFGANFVSLDRVNVTPEFQYEDHYTFTNNQELSALRSRDGNDGSYAELLDEVRTIDWTTTASYLYNINESFDLTGTAGLNYYDVYHRAISGQTQGGFVVPEVYNLGNSKDRAIATQDHSQRRIIGLFGNLKLGWEDKVFLEYSARNDWSSTLPVDNQSFFYQAVGASAIVSDLVGLSDGDFLNFMKFRTSYGTTGKDASIHLLNSTFNVNPTLVSYSDTYEVTTPLNGQTGISKGGLIGNNTLKPELTTTFEIGADFGFLDDRIELNYTYYKANSTEQIVVSELPRSSGYSQTPVNIGEVENRGHEVSLHLIPVVLNNGFKWDLNLTWSKNTNEVIKISDQADDLTIFDSGRGITLKAEVGEPFGTWKGQIPLLTDDGKQVVDGSGVRKYTDDQFTVGTVQPDWIGGAVSTFRFKGISLGFVLDVRQGSDIYSLTKSATFFNGTSVETTLNNREPFVVPNSVVENEDGTFSENTTTTSANPYLFDGNYTKYIIDGSFVKLREITLGYTLPRSLVSKISLQDVSVRLFAKNPKFWLSDENTYGDPEVNGPSGPTNATGVESSQTPPSRSYGINLNITL